MTMRPTFFPSADMSKKTRGRPIFLAAWANVLTEQPIKPELSKFLDDVVEAAAVRTAQLKVASIDSRRQIDDNAMFCRVMHFSFHFISFLLFFVFFFYLPPSCIDLASTVLDSSFL